MILIVAGGDPPSKALLSLRASKACRVIAADRGARYCLECGVRPDLVVGDMDSLDPTIREELRRMGVELKVLSPDKDETDTEIALGCALDERPERIEILAGLGGRFDHALANVHLLHKSMKQGVPAFLVSDREIVFVVAKRAVIKGAEGLTVSLLPLTGTVEGIVLEGFVYGLNAATMEIGRPYGVSNVVNAPMASIDVAGGVLAVVMQAPEAAWEAEVVTECKLGAMVCADR